MNNIIYQNLIGYFNVLIERMVDNKRFNHISLNKGTIYEYALFDDIFNNICEITRGRNFMELSEIFIFESANIQINIPKQELIRFFESEISFLKLGQNLNSIEVETYLGDVCSRLRIFSDNNNSI